MWIIIGSYVAALVAGFLLGVAFQTVRDIKELKEADAEYNRMIDENDRLSKENEALKIKLNFYKLGGNTKNESVQPSSEILPLST